MGEVKCGRPRLGSTAAGLTNTFNSCIVDTQPRAPVSRYNIPLCKPVMFPSFAAQARIALETNVKTKIILPLVLVAGLAACAQSTVQPMSQDTFKISTTAAPACGPNGARNVAFKTAAIEVIRRGGDKFVLTGDAAQSDFWSGSHNQSMVVRVIPENSPAARNALSARKQLGDNWQELVTEGAPTTCQ